MQKINYVYISYENNSDRFYIGSASCYGSPNEHNYFGSGRAITTGEFKPDWKWVYGEYATRKEAGLAEEALIRQADYRNNLLCMNRHCTGANHTEEAARKMSEARSGENHPMYGRTGSDSPNYGRTHSAETKSKMSEAKAGENHPMYGKTLSAETRAKMSQAKIDNRLHKFVHESDKAIIGTYYDLAANAKELFGFSYSSLHRLKEGKSQSVKGWQYAGIVEQE